MANDLYATLGVSKTASDADIKKAYKKLARKWHPDQNQEPGAEDRFKAISEAYTTLSDPAQRKQYDQSRSAPTGFAGGFADSGIGDIFGDLFRNKKAPQTPTAQPSDVETKVSLRFDQAIAGAKINVTLHVPSPCSACRGRGSASGHAPQVCPSCGGRGVAGDGGFFSSKVCQTCSGRGTVIPDPCTQCAGSGVEQVNKQLQVNIPAGIRDGARVRVRGKGSMGGDLYVRVHVQPHRFWRQEGKNLLAKIPITPLEALSQAAIQVPTLNGHKTIKIPAKTTTGTRVKLAGLGPNNTDLLYELVCRTPEVPAAAQEQLQALSAVIPSGDTWRKEFL